jgi:hypothetical protein
VATCCSLLAADHCVHGWCPHVQGMNALAACRHARRVSYRDTLHNHKGNKLPQYMTGIRPNEGSKAWLCITTATRDVNQWCVAITSIERSSQHPGHSRPISQSVCQPDLWCQRRCCQYCCDAVDISYQMWQKLLLSKQLPLDQQQLLQLTTIT